MMIVPRKHRQTTCTMGPSNQLRSFVVQP